jgi:hypothetical protein
VSASLQPINPYSKPNSPAFSKEFVQPPSAPLVPSVLRDWSDQSRSTGWTFILIAGACALVSWTIFVTEQTSIWPLVSAALIIVLGAVSLWAGTLACFRRRSGALWCCRLATALTVFFCVTAVAGILGSVLYGFDLVGGIVGSMVAGAISLPITSQAWRLIEFVRQLDRAGVPLNAPVPTPITWR